MVNNQKLKAYIDFGSSCSIIRVSDVNRLKIPMDKNCDVIIKGYGLNQVKALGKLKLTTYTDL